MRITYKSLNLGACALALMAAAAMPAQAQEVRFTDLSGREIVLDGPAERIVAIINPAAGTAIAVHGSPERLAGINPSTRIQFEEGFLGRLFPEVFDIPSDIVSTGFVPNVETIAALNPEVIIQWGDRGDDLVAPLENAGLTVARYQSLPGGGEETAVALLRMLGEMIGDTSRADYLIDLRSDVRARLEGITAPIPEEERPSVLIMRATADQFTVSGGGPLHANYIYPVGGVNAAASAPVSLTATSPEQIAAWDPDVILLLHTPGYTPQVIYDHPILSLTSAGQDRRVYALPIGSHIWGASGPEDPLTWTFVAELLYPDLLDRSLRDLMRDAYQVMYDHEFTDAELDETLLLDVNGISANYDRFRAQ